MKIGGHRMHQERAHWRRRAAGRAFGRGRRRGGRGPRGRVCSWASPPTVRRSRTARYSRRHGDASSCRRRAHQRSLRFCNGRWPWARFLALNDPGAKMGNCFTGLFSSLSASQRGAEQTLLGAAYCAPAWPL